MGTVCLPGISALGRLREENCREFKIKLWLQSKILPQHQKEGKKITKESHKSWAFRYCKNEYGVGEKKPGNSKWSLSRPTASVHLLLWTPRVLCVMWHRLHLSRKHLTTEWKLLLVWIEVFFFSAHSFIFLQKIQWFNYGRCVLIFSHCHSSACENQINMSLDFTVFDFKIAIWVTDLSFIKIIQ